MASQILLRLVGGSATALEEGTFSLTRTVMPRSLLVQSRRNEVGVSFGGICRGQKLSVWRGRARREVIGEIAVV